MSFIDRAKNKVEEVVGEFKESVGEAYGNEALELDGEAEADAAREREEAHAARDPRDPDDLGGAPARAG